MYSRLMEAVHRILAVNERLDAEAAALQAVPEAFLVEYARRRAQDVSPMRGERTRERLPVAIHI